MHGGQTWRMRPYSYISTEKKVNLLANNRFLRRVNPVLMKQGMKALRVRREWFQLITDPGPVLFRWRASVTNVGPLDNQLWAITSSTLSWLNALDEVFCPLETVDGPHGGGRSFHLQARLPSHWNTGLNPLTAKLFNLNFHPHDVVSRWRDPQLQVSENYSVLTKWRSTVFKYCWLISHFIFNMFKRWYIMC